MKKAIWVLFLITVGFGFAPALLGQQPGQVGGTVDDPTGAPVSQAAVKLILQTTGTALEAVTDDLGQFVFTGVAPGEYKLQVKMKGFERAELPLTVGTSPTSDQRLRLKVASVEEEIVVSARSGDPISPDQNTSAVQLEHDLLRSLPAKDENPLAVASLFVDPAANGVEGTKIVVDGVEGNELDVSSTSVKNIAINNNPYSVEFSRPGRGRIEVVTRGGSLRRFHRRFAFIFRDASMDARNPFAVVRPPRQREWLEGQIDGPLARGKATFFLSGDYLRDNDNAFITAETPGGPLAETLGIPRRTARVFARTDIRITPVQILSVRYNWSWDSLANQGVGAFDLPQRAWNSTNVTHEVRISETATPTANFLNEVRFDFKARPKDAHSLTDAPAILVQGAFNSGGAEISRRDREDNVEFQDLVSYFHGRHSFRFGEVLKSRFIDSTDRSNFGGTFTFSDLLSFASKQPSLFSVKQGDPRVSFTQLEFAYFFQDEIRLWPRFGLVLGFRHELQSNLDDHDNLAPRVALNYTTADSRTVLRAGAGIFYERQPVILEQQYLLLDGSHLRQIVISDPGFPLAGSPSALTNLPPSVVRIDPRIRTPYAIQASFGVERKFGRQTYLSADYTLLRGLKLYRMRDVNAPPPATGLRPDPNFLNVDQFETSGSSHTHSLSLGLRTTALRGRLQLISQYTLSHAIDDTSGLFSLPADNFELRGERGRADFDQRHRFNLATFLMLPRGFSLGLVASVRSGVPYTVTTGFDNNNDSVLNDRPSLGNINAPFPSFAVDGSFVAGTSGVLYDGRKALSGGGLVPVNANDVHWLILPGVGNVRRNSENGPGLANVDLGFSKKFILRDNDNKTKGSRDVEFRCDAFNLLNHVNFRNYIGTLTSPFFGQANDAFPTRKLQLSVRLRL